MSFHSSYLAFFRQVYLKIKGTTSNSLALGALLSQINSEEALVEVDEIESILTELQQIDNLLFDLSLTGELSEARNNLDILLAEELKKSLEKNQHPIPGAKLERWLKANIKTGAFLINQIGGSSWLKQKLIEKETLFLAANKKILKADLLSIVLNYMLRLGDLPAKEWYLSLGALKAFDSHDAVLQLAFNDLQAFQDLDARFPGFLVHAVSSFEELSIFCQLLPNTFERLLHAPRVKPFIPDAVHYVQILDKLMALPRPRFCRLIESYITQLDDLVAVVNAYPSLHLLIAGERRTESSSKRILAERPCARLIQTRADLLRFDLTIPELLIIIQKLPRFRDLVGLANTFPLDATKSIVEQTRHTSVPTRKSIAYGFFPERLPKPFIPFSEQVLDERFLTLGQAINCMQYLDNAGYYSSGNIEFTSDTNKEGHFHTEASEGHVLAIALSHRAFQIWLQLPIEDQKCFEILECGAGEGDLCFKMLSFIKAMAVEDKDWAEFAKAIHYTVIEIASALVERQKQKLDHFIKQGTVEVIQDDALKMTHYNKKAALHLSNELMDMLPSEQVVIDEEGRCQVKMAIPVLLPEAYSYLQKHYPESVAGLKEESARFKLFLTQQKMNIDHQGLVITAARFKKLLAITANKQFAGPSNCFLFSYPVLPLNLFPDLEQYLAKHDEILASMRPGDSKIICPYLDTYAQLMADKALVSIVIDYGELSFKLKNVDYRCYGSSSPLYRNIPFRQPGKLDITYDVDFSALVTGLKQRAASGKACLTYLGTLLPEINVLPQDYQTHCTEGEQLEFRKSPFFAVVFVAPGVNVVLKDIEKKAFPVVTQHQFFALALQRAKSIVEFNVMVEEARTKIFL
ncbi:SAM-dependent methyltransferase [Legionella maioricensis]|uniref:SAM-dependent methyltransferase n=1 Tax=Legionella maioricensis TaxID=2896528 RepID=A0A9X2D0F7_9GAMM|nr:SAM-dependent methyltransferase [Legionella maioricensis]MCL9684029.1 SAM-dependent methyltransferase [Legionella maioricensis]MCL9687926.1 SAM-dependent methyltransferase [Legionella maioricensis]